MLEGVVCMGALRCAPRLRSRGSIIRKGDLVVAEGLDCRASVTCCGDFLSFGDLTCHGDFTCEGGLLCRGTVTCHGAINFKGDVDCPRGIVNDIVKTKSPTIDDWFAEIIAREPGIRFKGVPEDAFLGSILDRIGAMNQQTRTHAKQVISLRASLRKSGCTA